MPRPQSRTQLSNKPNSSAASSNPISAWLARREERKQAQAAEAARAITGETSENELKIQEMLDGISFVRSRLPREKLEYRTTQNQTYGDLELAARALAQSLRRNPVTVQADIRKIDEKIYKLAELYKNAVEQGNVNAVYVAKAGLAHGIQDIRCKVSTTPPELIGQFVEKNTTYLDQWITAADIALNVDSVQKNLDAQQADYKAANDKYKAELKDQLAKIQADKTMFAAYLVLKETTSLENRAKWTPAQEECYQILVKRRLKGITIQAMKTNVDYSEKTIIQLRGKLEILDNSLKALPIPVDPDQMNKYNAAIDDMMKNLAKSDQEFDEAVRAAEDLSARLTQLNTAPGQIRALEAASVQAAQDLEDMKAIQEEAINRGSATLAQDLKALGLYTEEDIQKLKEQNERAEKEQMEKLIQESGIENVDVDTDEDAEWNYNN